MAPNGQFSHCCFSPTGKLLAGSTFDAICIWDLTSSIPCLVETKQIQYADFRSIVFSSSYIVSCRVGSIHFWPIDTWSLDSDEADSESIQPTGASIMSITLQIKEGIAILTDTTGVVRILDILTGLFKSSFCTKAGPKSLRDTRLINDKLIFVWCTIRKIHIWNTGREEPLKTVDAKSNFSTTNLRISSDGSKVFLWDHQYLYALSTWTGEVVGEVKLEGELSGDPLTIDGSRVWVCFKGSQTQGWDFGISGMAPVPLSDIPPDPDRPQLDFIDGTKEQNTGPSRIEDVVTGKEVYRLPMEYQESEISQWDGQYLVTCRYGEVMILDFSHMIPQ